MRKDKKLSRTQTATKFQSLETKFHSLLASWDFPIASRMLDKGIIGLCSFSMPSFSLKYLDHLYKAKDKCDCLVVGIRTSSSIKKELSIYSSCPVQVEEDNFRLSLVSSLEMVDYCFLFEEKTDWENYYVIKPDRIFHPIEFAIKPSLKKEDYVFTY